MRTAVFTVLAALTLGALSRWYLQQSQRSSAPEILHGRAVTVHTGDEFDLIESDGQRQTVRLAGITAPRGGSVIADTSRRSLNSLVGGYSVTVTVVERDSDRIVGEARMGSRHLAATQVRRGMAEVNDRPFRRPGPALLEARNDAQRRHSTLYSLSLDRPRLAGDLRRPRPYTPQGHSYEVFTLNLQDFEFQMRQARGHGYACTNNLQLIPYPYRSITKRTVNLAVARTYTLSDSRGTFNVIIAMRQRTTKNEKDIEIWCGDQFLEGRSLSSDQAMQRCMEATEGLPDAEGLRAEMRSHFAALSVSSQCDFWKLKRAKPSKLCQHTEHVLAELFTPADLHEMAVTLDGWRNGAPAAGSSQLKTGALNGLLFKVPVLIEGDRGSGKTTEAHAFAKEGSYPLILLPGHEGVEATDLLGNYVPVGDGSLVWKDGPMSQAFRLGAKGRKAVLLIDELLRIPSRQQSVLLSALSPIDRCYWLRTGRILKVEDGIGEEEVIRCPVENLAVVATTNVGGDYALDALDPAIAERWMILRKDTTEEGLREVLTGLVSGRGFSVAVVNRLLRFYKKAKELSNASQIARLPTTRTITRAVELAAVESEVGTMLFNQALLWVERNLDGYPVQQQIDSIRQLVNGVFPDATGRVLL